MPIAYFVIVYYSIIVYSIDKHSLLKHLETEGCRHHTVLDTQGFLFLRALVYRAFLRLRISHRIVVV